MRRRSSIAFAASILVCTGGSLANAESVNNYGTLIAKAGKKSVQATLGLHCFPVPNGSDCNAGNPESVSYPLKTKGLIEVNRDGEITLLFGAPMGDVRWRTARIDGKGKEVATAQGVAKLVTKTKKRWRIRLPKTLKTSSTIVGIDAQAPNAYASFEFGIKVVKKKK